MNFTAIDFETAHAEFPCEIGLTRVENGVIINSKSWSVKPACFPYMNPWNQRVHGISSADVASALTFEELWGELKPWFEDNYLVAHNAAFDMRVLRSVLARYDLAIPWAEYFCSVSVSRKTWKHLPSHSLGVVSQYHNIQFNHHRAGDDAKACAIIALKAFEEAGATNVQQGLSKLGIALKRL
ncbi:MAG TPA: 3'-5' exonuclease [Paludibacter sp.]|nr:3'-5' exonuclease [Paludibacter sp.]